MIGFRCGTVYVYDTVRYEDKAGDSNEASLDILPRVEDPNGGAAMHGASNEVRIQVHGVVPSRR